MIHRTGSSTSSSRQTSLSKALKKTSNKTKTLIPLGDFLLGNKAIGVIAGPCAVESREQIIEIAQFVQSLGAIALRGGAYKGRTSPYAFQGHKEKALQWLAEAKEITGLPIVSEVLDQETLPMLCDYVDLLQVGTRNMQNYPLLEKLAQCPKPVLLKRGMCATLEEFLSAAEYLLNGGNEHVILCERGIRTFSQFHRNTFDINILPVLKEISHLPVIADPSHATGDARYVPAIARSAIAAGADGLLIEVHPDPPKALSDGQQSLNFEQFEKLMEEIQKIAIAINRSL